MKIEYIRTAKHSYMIVKEAEFPFEQYEIQMILHNNISSLLKMQIIVADGQAEYWYEVTGMQSLEKQFEFETMGMQSLKRLLVGICDMKKQMEDYMLDDQNIDFSPTMTFYDRIEEKVRFCYIPGYRQMQAPGIRGLLENVLQHLDHSDEGAVKLAYEMYDRCVKSEFIVEECMRCINAGAANLDVIRQDSDAVPVDAIADEIESSGFSMDEEDIFLPEHKWVPGKRKKRDQRQKENRKKHAVDYREIRKKERIPAYVAEASQIKEEMNPTICFSELQLLWELTYCGDGNADNIRLNKFPFLIGKDAERVDAVLPVNTVSRVHAQVTKSENQLYLEDYNSTNGTYLNGKLLPMNTPTEIQKGDHIVLGTEEYVLVDRQIPKC